MKWSARRSHTPIGTRYAAHLDIVGTQALLSGRTKNTRQLMDHLSLQELVNKLPGPLAKSCSRLTVATAGRDLFETASVAFENFLKYLTCIVVAGFHSLDSDAAYEMEFKISRASSIGEWGGCLRSSLVTL